MRKSQVLFFCNYTKIENIGRATKIKIFKKKYLAKKFMENKYGYIIRQDNISNSISSFCNGFIPSAQEELHIKSLCKIKG